ncbi:hypothetical protein P154DRAFT_570019 [Amniculicola lignicola CBS 123094]|uniref:Uncharacterized protein n=1 Tax=Amniculicola lignicola CBS 123094 TaxID=1392246 RepID=A0A6A5WY75_9PLEO|nr:hypothetical protein P154DRAFT_570019 [Amniculicola lignicola CBS 123094]
MAGAEISSLVLPPYTAPSESPPHPVSDALGLKAQLQHYLVEILVVEHGDWITTFEAERHEIYDAVAKPTGALRIPLRYTLDILVMYSEHRCDSAKWENIRVSSWAPKVGGRGHCSGCLPGWTPCGPTVNSSWKHHRTKGLDRY